MPGIFLTKRNTDRKWILVFFNLMTNIEENAKEYKIWQVELRGHSCTKQCWCKTLWFEHLRRNEWLEKQNPTNVFLLRGSISVYGKVKKPVWDLQSVLHQVSGVSAVWKNNLSSLCKRNIFQLLPLNLSLPAHSGKSTNHLQFSLGTLNWQKQTSKQNSTTTTKSQ